MNKIMTYTVSVLLSVAFISGTASLNTVHASAKTSPTKKATSFKKKRMPGCHNLSTSTLNKKAKRFRKTISAAAKKYGVSENLIKAVITTESCFKPRARGTSGEKGLMQLMYLTGKRFKVRNRFSTWQNIHGGTRYLSFLLNRYDNNLRYAVAAYNTGEGRIRKGGYIPNKDYVYKVMSAYNKFSSKRGGKRRYARAQLRKKGGYRVQKGEFLSSIAAKHGVSLTRLAKANKLRKPYRIKTGQTLYIPKTKKYKKNNRRARHANSRSGKQYRVRSGDTIYSIMRKTGIPVKTLMQKNNLRNPKHLKVNQLLKL